jgi:hypothetical protein
MGRAQSRILVDHILDDFSVGRSGIHFITSVRSAMVMDNSVIPHSLIDENDSLKSMSTNSSQLWQCLVLYHRQVHLEPSLIGQRSTNQSIILIVITDPIPIDRISL